MKFTSITDPNLKGLPKLLLPIGLTTLKKLTHLFYLPGFPPLPPAASGDQLNPSPYYPIITHQSPHYPVPLPIPRIKILLVVLAI